MNVYFVCRTPYQENFKFHKKFRKISVLDWFQYFWRIDRSDEDSFYANLKEYIGISVYGLDRYGLANAIYEGDAIMPQNYEELINCLIEYSYVKKISIHNNNLLQVYTDDDEVDIAYYIFDEQYLQENKLKVEYLLMQELNMGYSDARFSEQVYVKTLFTKQESLNSTYFVVFSAWGDNNMYNLEKYRNSVICIKGVELEKLPDFLYSWNPLTTPDLVPTELLLLKSQAKIVSSSNDLESYLKNLTQFPISILDDKKFFDENIIFGQESDKIDEAIRDAVENRNAFLTQNNVAISFDPALCSIDIKPHIVTSKFHLGKIHGKDVYDYWMIFDSSWASANYMLANSIINFASKWSIE